MWMVNKNVCPATISASIIAANVWKNSLKTVESDNNKILYETLLDFLQRNGTYFLNKPRMYLFCNAKPARSIGYYFVNKRFHDCITFYFIV